MAKKYTTRFEISTDAMEMLPELKKFKDELSDLMKSMTGDTLSLSAPIPVAIYKLTSSKKLSPENVKLAMQVIQEQLNEKAKAEGLPALHVSLLPAKFRQRKAHA